MPKTHFSTFSRNLFCILLQDVECIATDDCEYWFWWRKTPLCLTIERLGLISNSLFIWSNLTFWVLVIQWIVSMKRFFLNQINFNQRNWLAYHASTWTEYLIDALDTAVPDCPIVVVSIEYIELHWLLSTLYMKHVLKRIADAFTDSNSTSKCPHGDADDLHRINRNYCRFITNVTWTNSVTYYISVVILSLEISKCSIFL